MAQTLEQNPRSAAGRRVVFLASDDEQASAELLGFAPIHLGRLSEGGALVHARGRKWGPLIFKDLFKGD